MDTGQKDVNGGTGLMDTGRKDANGGTDLMDTGRKYETGSDGLRGAGAGRAEDADLMKACRLCPRNCGADRSAGRTGACGVTAEIRVGRAALHMWEEPCISGKQGSGTVFFAGCSLGCVYCQNAELSGARAGKIISAERLAEIFLELQEKGAANINLVTASHYIPQTAESLTRARRAGLTIPAVFNCSGYEKPESLPGGPPVFRRGGLSGAGEGSAGGNGAPAAVSEIRRAGDDAEGRDRAPSAAAGACGERETDGSLCL